jgi:hypothetical protein
MNRFRTLFQILLIFCLLGSLQAGQADLLVIDDFEEGILAIGDKWDDPISLFGRLDAIDRLGFDQAAGVLTLTNDSLGSLDGYLPSIVPDASLDEAGKFVQVTVTIPDSPFLDPCASVGLTVVPNNPQPPSDKANSLRFGLRGDGQLEYIMYRQDNQKHPGANPVLPIPYAPGDRVTLRLLRTDDVGGLGPPDGGGLSLLFRLDDVPNADFHMWHDRHLEMDEFPLFAGLQMGNGTCDYTATFDDFAAGFQPLLEAPPSGLLMNKREDGTAVDISWVNEDAYDAIKIYRFSELIAELDGTATGYVDENAPPGLLSYSIRAEIDGAHGWGCKTYIEHPNSADGGEDRGCRSRPQPFVAPQDPLPGRPDGWTLDATEESPSGFACSRSGNTVTLDWRNEAAYTSIIILRNEELVAELDGSAESFIDEGVLPGPTRYELLALAGVSILSGERCDATGVSPRGRIVDDYNDEVFNADGKWSGPIATAGTLDPLPGLDEEVNAGVLSIDYTGPGGQNLAYVREDDNALLDNIGEWVEVTVAFLEPMGGDQDTGCARMGLHMGAGPAAEHMTGSRTDTFRFGLEYRGRLRFHGFRSVDTGEVIVEEEWADPAWGLTSEERGGYVVGSDAPVTLRITRTGEREFTFSYGFNGVADTIAFNGPRTLPAGSPLPIFPGMMLESGCSYKASFENFTVGTLDPTCITDDFDDEVYNDDGGWLEGLVVMEGGHDPAAITLNEEVNAGVLTVTNTADNAKLATVRVGETLDVIGEFVEVTVAYLEPRPGDQDTGCARLGINLQAAPPGEHPIGSRTDTFRFGLEYRGRLRFHGFRSVDTGEGIVEEEWADPSWGLTSEERGGYEVGSDQPITVRITRTGEREFTFSYGFNGVADTVAFNGPRVVPEGSPLPLYAGVLLESGCSYTASVENFRVCTPPLPCGPLLADDFNDEVYNDDGGWLEDLVVMEGGHDPGAITLDEEVNAGVLTVMNIADNAKLATVRVGEDDVLDEIGKSVQVTVAFIEPRPGDQDTGCARMGINLQAAPPGEHPMGSRTDTFRYGLEYRGRLRFHAFRSVDTGEGIIEEEWADPSWTITRETRGGYVTGSDQTVTVAIERSGLREFTFRYGFDGQADRLAFRGPRVVPEGSPLPIYPGLLIESGCSYVASFDNFMVGCLDYPTPIAEHMDFVRADINGDGAIDVTDAVGVANFLFLGIGPIPTCRKALDSNDTGVIDISDIIYLLSWAFLGGPDIPLPNECGQDKTGDTLDCEMFDLCP